MFWVAIGVCYEQFRFEIISKNVIEIQSKYWGRKFEEKDFLID